MKPGLRCDAEAHSPKVFYTCGAPAKGVVQGSPVCGIHANVAKRWGQTVEPLPEDADQ